MKTYTSKGGTSLLEGCLGAEDSIRDKSIVRERGLCDHVTPRDLELVQSHAIALEALDGELRSVRRSRLGGFPVVQALR